MGNKLYDEKNTVRISLKLNSNTDADILSMLQAKKNKQGYIKELLKNDLDRVSSGSDIFVRIEKQYNEKERSL